MTLEKKKEGHSGSPSVQEEPMDKPVNGPWDLVGTFWWGLLIWFLVFSFIEPFINRIAAATLMGAIGLAWLVSVWLTSEDSQKVWKWSARIIVLWLGILVWITEYGKVGL